MALALRAPGDEMGPGDADGLVFLHEARREGRTVAVIRGIPGPDGSVTVETQVYPVTAPANADPQTRPYTFRTREQAAHFAEEALLALEYLGCMLAD